MRKASREFQVFAKPAGAVCNLDCSYCYYLKKLDLYPHAGTPRMPDDLLENYIVQHIEATPTEEIHFSWHGGEPTLLGLDYFRKIVALEKKHQPAGRRIFNGVQTNGVLLNDEWARFFAAERFSVGVSMDGPAELHDRYRVNKGQEPTHWQTVRGFELLVRHKVVCDIVCVVNEANAQRPLEVYRFFKQIGGQYLSFLPLVERTGDGCGVTDRTVPAAAYGDFLCAIFDEWMREDTGRVNVQTFEEASRSIRGLDHSLCIYRVTCGEIPVVEHNGDFYSCDHFVTPELRVGNIFETPFVDLFESPMHIAFGNAKRDALPRFCRECEFLAMCNGGCPKDRFLTTPDGEPGLNYLCAGLKRFFRHSRRYLIRLAARQQADLLAERMKQPPRTEIVIPGPSAGRNDFCPCGSGRKYKKCCLGK